MAEKPSSTYHRTLGGRSVARFSLSECKLTLSKVGFTRKQTVTVSSVLIPDDGMKETNQSSATV